MHSPSHDAPYRHIFEHAGSGIARLSLKGRFLEVNPRLAALLGRPADSLVGLHVQDLTHPDDWPVSQAQIQAALQGHAERYTLEKRYLHASQAPVWVAVTVSLWRDEQGEPREFLTIVEDIGERRRAQEALASAQAAERASKAKTEFLSRMSHELRTPLNAMLGFAQLLRVDMQHPLSEPQRQKVDHIEKAGAHLLAMLTDVLDLSRIEAGSLPMQCQALPVAPVMDEAADLVAHQVREAQLRLHITAAPADWRLLGDPVRVRQVLVNLLSNAIKYNRPGGWVQLEAQVVNGRVALSVSDNGPGLSPAQQAHLFEPFNRLGAERSGVEGTGIGLVIVKRLVELMGGEVQVSSTPEVGTTVRVWLPQAEAPAADHADAPRSTRSGFGALDDDGTRTLHVLYAEDNPVNVELVRQVMLMRPQWTLTVATCGADAIAMAISRPPDLLLLDMHLGDMSGLDVSDALHAHPATSDIPRAALSADVMPDQIEAARQRGFVEYLSKPLDVGGLLKLLDRCAQGELPLPE